MKERELRKQCLKGALSTGGELELALRWQNGME